MKKLYPAKGYTKQQWIYRVLTLRGPLSTQELAHAVGQRMQRVSASLNILRRKGCVVRHDNTVPYTYAAVEGKPPQDRRGLPRPKPTAHALDYYWGRRNEVAG